MGVQVVRDHLIKEGYKLMSWQGNPEVQPAIWFIGKSGGPEWVVVRSTKYPANHIDRPANWEEIAANCSRLSKTGHYASVALVSNNQPFQSGDEEPVPLWRGEGMYVNLSGLE